MKLRVKLNRIRTEKISRQMTYSLCYFPSEWVVMKENPAPLPQKAGRNEEFPENIYGRYFILFAFIHNYLFFSKSLN